MFCLQAPCFSFSLRARFHQQGHLRHRGLKSGVRRGQSHGNIICSTSVKICIQFCARHCTLRQVKLSVVMKGFLLESNGVIRRWLSSGCKGFVWISRQQHINHAKQRDTPSSEHTSSRLQCPIQVLTPPAGRLLRRAILLTWRIS